MHSPHTRKGLFGIKWRQRHSTKNTPGQSSPKLSPISSPLERKEVITPWQVSLHNVNFKEIFSCKVPSSLCFLFSLNELYSKLALLFIVLVFAFKWKLLSLFPNTLSQRRPYKQNSNYYYIYVNSKKRGTISRHPDLRIICSGSCFVCVFKIIYYEFGLVKRRGHEIHSKPLESQFIHFSVLIFNKILS